MSCARNHTFRKHVLRLGLSFAFALVLPAPSSVIVAEERPNILFIYTDDQSHRTVGCYPDSFDWVETPNIDALARQGVRFDHAYIGSWCMPSRATMLTGMHQHGIESMRMDGQYPRSLYDPAKCPFWPKVFRESGYTTAQIGKWHTGIDAGFGRDWDYQIVWNRPLHPDNAPNYYDNQLTSFQGQKPRMVEGYTTDNYTDWAIEFIEGKGRAVDKPWYLWLCYGAVHGPFSPADRHLDDYANVEVPIPPSIYPPRSGKPKYVEEMVYWEKGKQGQPVERKVRDTAPVGMKDLPGRSLGEWVRQYHQGVKAIDENVGRLLESLVETGQDENTLVVFTSDQGFAWGQHGFKSKVAPYRATVEAPFIIRLPKGESAATAGKVVKEPVSGVDIPPTLFSQAGIELPWKMHGHDLTPVLTERETKWKYPAMLVHTGRKYGAETARVPAPDSPDLYHGPGVPWYIMLSEGKYKYIRNLVRNETEELYDIEADPDELTNLAIDSHYDLLLQEFREAMQKELRRTDAKLVDNLPPHGTLRKRKAK